MTMHLSYDFIVTLQLISFQKDKVVLLLAQGYN